MVSFRGLRIIIFLAELNELELWWTDIGYAYFEAKTQEKVYTIAGPEFHELEGHILAIFKAPFGLCSSGKRLSERLADYPQEMGFTPCKAEPDIWMRKKGYLYEYIGS